MTNASFAFRLQKVIARKIIHCWWRRKCIFYADYWLKNIVRQWKQHHERKRNRRQQSQYVQFYFTYFASNSEYVFIQASEALQGLLTEETTGSGGVSDTQLIDNVWRPAEAYHFYILAQQQYKANNADGALRCALALTEYEDILPVQTIYNLIGNW